MFPKPSIFGLTCILLLTVTACNSGVESVAKSSDPSAELARDAVTAGVQWAFPPKPIANVEQRIVGNGAEAAVLLWASKTEPSADAVILLHSWIPLPPSSRSADIRRYIERGRTVVYPVYQGLDTPVDEIQENAMRGIEVALDELDADPRTLVAIGRTTGGALAFDYAALAPSAGIPGPQAVVAIHPGRRPGGVIKPANLTSIPNQTNLMVITSDDTRVPEGEREALSLIRGSINVPRRRRLLFRPTTSSYAAERSLPSPKLQIRRAIDRFLKISLRGSW